VPKRAVLKVVKVNYTPSAPWMVRVPEQLQKIEAAKKKFFRRESVAKAYVERLARQLGDYHAQALGLSDRQKLEASECYRLLEGHNASLLGAVHHFLRYREHAKRSLPLGELLTEFLAIKEQDNASRRYLADLRSKVGRFVAAHESWLTCDVTAADVEHWIRSLDIGPVSRESYRRNLSTFLEFGRRRGYSRINPAADIKIRRRPEGEEIHLFLSEKQGSFSDNVCLIKCLKSFITRFLIAYMARGGVGCLLQNGFLTSVRVLPWIKHSTDWRTQERYED
jgi:hypothetical protein